MGVRIFLACAFGATIGTLVALNSNPNFWWVGLLVGAFAGYVTFDLRAIIVAIPQAWAKAKPEMESPELIRRALERWLVSLVTMVAGVFLAMLLFWNLLFWVFRLVDDPTEAWSVPPSSVALVLSIFISAFTAAMELRAAFEKAAEDLTPRGNYHIANQKRAELAAMLNYNPISVFIILPARIIWNDVLPLMFDICVALVIGCANVVRVVITSIPAFARQLFILIHSELRLLCACDAAIGAGIGYAAGSAIIGALAGGAFGVLNYEVISKRLLKLVPVKA